MSQPGLRKSLEKAHEALRVAINMHDTAGCIGDSCSYPYDLQETALAAVRAALAITESDPKLIEQLSELVAEWRRRLDIHRQCGIDGNYKTCSDELELVIQGLTANDAANQTHGIKPQPKPSCTRCGGEGYIPMLDPMGAFLHVVPGMKDPCPDCTPVPHCSCKETKPILPAPHTEVEICNCDVDYYDGRVRPPCPVHVVQHKRVKRQPETEQPGAQPMRAALLWFKKNMGPEMDYGRAMRVVENALLSVTTVEVRETKPDNIFWPPQNEAEEHLYEIRNARTKEYVQVHVDALKELYQSIALQDMIFKLPKEVKERVRYYCAEERS